MADSRSIPSTKRHKLSAIGIAIALLLGVAVFLIWAGRSLTASRVDRWLPARPGDAVVLGKAMAAGSPVLILRIDVPQASPAEAALLPAELEGRAAMLPPRSFEKTVPVTAAQWSAIEAGAPLRAMFQINVRRSDIFVSAVYLDASTPHAAVGEEDGMR